MKEKYPGIDVRAYYEEIDANIKPLYTQVTGIIV